MAKNAKKCQPKSTNKIIAGVFVTEGSRILGPAEAFHQMKDMEKIVIIHSRNKGAAGRQ